jgi:hypothetical protein
MICISVPVTTTLAANKKKKNMKKVKCACFVPAL